MKSAVITIFIIIAVLLFGIAGYKWFKSTEEPTPETETTYQATETTNSETTEKLTPKNLASLLQSGENKTCTYELMQDNKTISGAVFISGDNMRTNYEITSDEPTQNMTGSMIKMGDKMYIWSSQMQQGVMMQYDLEELQAQYEKSESQPGQPSNPAPFDINKEMEYKCDSWNVDDNMFTPPSDIEFIDMSAMMNDIPKMQDPCAVCNSLPGDKTACLKQFNCAQ